MNRNKEKIKRRFTRAAATYDQQAVIQFKVADRLLNLIGQHAIVPPQKIFEIGCCTGLLTERIVDRFPGTSTLYINDLIPGFKQIVSDRITRNIHFEFIEGDIETVPLPDELDLVISSSTFHWLEDLPSLLIRLKEKITPEGLLAFSMYSVHNLKEIKEIAGIGLSYPDPEQLKDMVGQHFQVLTFEEELITFKFNDPLDILRHLRETGVNALDGPTWSRSRLKEFIKLYRSRFSDNDHVRLTYHPVYCVARKSE